MPTHVEVTHATDAMPCMFLMRTGRRCCRMFWMRRKCISVGVFVCSQSETKAVRCSVRYRPTSLLILSCFNTGHVWRSQFVTDNRKIRVARLGVDAQHRIDDDHRPCMGGRGKDKALRRLGGRLHPMVQALSIQRTRYYRFHWAGLALTGMFETPNQTDLPKAIAAGYAASSRLT